MVTLRQKPAGVVGLPADTKEQGKRVDFRVDDFSLGIETKGYRLAWKRAAYCPCVPVNTPVCASVDPKVIGTLDGLQAKIATGAAVIHGIMTSIAAHDTPYDQAMRRIEGTKNCSTRAENKLGYYDQLVDLDATIVYSQILETNGTDTDTTRYPIVLANLVRSEGQVFGDPVHYSIVDGDIKWVTIPTKGTRLGIHYLTYPHWRVVEHPHMTRHTLVKFKTTKPTTPQGDPSDLPVQAVCKLEFLL
jgi:hypothetical protein